jgi:hypothetical protein
MKKAPSQSRLEAMAGKLLFAVNLSPFWTTKRTWSEFIAFSGD